MIKTKGGMIVGGSNFWGADTTFIGSGAKKTFNQIIKSLFANNEQGFAYDPNDLSTMYQDAAGTIPVTSVGQPVGLIRDKSGRNNHAYQTVSASRPLLGRHPEGGARNLLSYSGTVTDASWQFTGGTKTGGQLDSDGGYTATKVTGPATSAPVKSSAVNQTGIYTYTICLKAGAQTTAKVLVRNTSTSTNYVIGDINLVTGVITGAGWTSKAKPNGFWECVYTTPVPINSGEVLQFYYGETISSSSESFDIIVDYAQLEVGPISTNYQETTTLLDITEKGKANCYYLKFDGVDDFLQTNNIDFTATDKVSLFAGVRKLSDAAQGMLIELSAAWATNAGSFVVLAPSYSGGAAYSVGARLSVADTANQQSIVNGYSSPVSSLITALMSTDTKVRIDGVLKATNTSNKGTGTYGNHPLYIGRRGGALIPFNGHIYSLIGVGRLTTDAETIALEKSIAKNTGVTLSV